MATPELRIAIAGCGHAARVHLSRILAIEGVRVVGCADPDAAAARAFAAAVPAGPEGPVPALADHAELLRQTAPDALGIFTPHRRHYRLAVDALQAGCHLFIERPLSTNTQEAVDIVGLARGRGRKVGVGHQYRLQPSFLEARRRLAAGAIGPLRMATATLALPWLAAHADAENAWRLEPKVPGGGILADAGSHLIDALLWVTGQSAHEVIALQSRWESKFDLVTAAAIRLADGTPATLAVSGDSPGTLFALTLFGEHGRLHATDQALEVALGEGPAESVPLSAPEQTIDGNFVAAVRAEAPLCCPAEEALEAVRLLEAIVQSVTTGQLVRLA